MKVSYIDHMGSDLTVVNAARVSFGKKSDYRYYGKNKETGLDYPVQKEFFPGEGESLGVIYKKDLFPQDRKLISYLARRGHWTPFGHPQITLHIKVPIFVARQLHKHQVGFVVNEVSRRYVDEEPEFYKVPSWGWRKKSKDKKQGSSEEVFPGENINNHEQWKLNSYCLHQYRRMINLGVCPEQARMVLPLSTYTEFYMTGSLAAWARLYNLRSQPDAQKEVQEVAKQISEIIEPLFPVSWGPLVKENSRDS